MRVTLNGHCQHDETYSAYAADQNWVYNAKNITQHVDIHNHPAVKRKADADKAAADKAAADKAAADKAAKDAAARAAKAAKDAAKKIVKPKSKSRRRRSRGH